MNLDTSAFSLAGKRALVTGASRGIGRAIATSLARAGADVAVTSRAGQRLSDTVKDIELIGRRALALVMDVSEVKSCQAAVEEGARVFGGIDILVNNAGIEQVCPSLDVSEDLLGPDFGY